MLVIIVVVVLAAALSYANGANDNSKGVATLVGFGAATPRQALFWAMITTAIGAGFSFLVAGGMVEAFKARLTLLGCFDSLSDDFSVQIVRHPLGDA